MRSPSFGGRGKVTRAAGWIVARGFVEAAAGHRAEAQQTPAQLKRLSGRKFVRSYGVALVYAGLGQDDDAFTRLNSAFDERSHRLV